MAAKRKQGKPVSPVDDGRDKPDFAADWFHPERAQKKEKAKDNTSDDSAKLSEALNNQVQRKLEAMKAELTKEAELAEAKQALTSKAKRPASSKGKATGTASRKFTDDEKDNLSFAELFNPSDPEDESFEELLDESALDWRKFKDE